ncbi:uncharacterized protein NPIL_678461 [Nephila pilipes]|uniref:Uncharacterized protein n=1 Tax=Nephila pilipes TaxID=299642 RepID=A0A8X6U5R0_NEPPI|nr:uncharacterized protein NPIL_678461 [Nephila pilipes]
MRLLLTALCVFCLMVVISAKKQIQENIDPIEGETKEHSSKKYSKENQKSHHHGHKHKKHSVLDQPKADTQPKAAPVEVPEADIQLQSDIETSKKAIHEQKQKAEVEDLHLQDLTYEENLKKDKKKKKGHHGVHHAENNQKRKEKDQKLFADQEEKNPVEEKVIEDSFEPLKETRNDAERKNKNKDKKPKDKSKNKKAYEKKDKNNKKSKDGKKKYNKDKKNKDKRKW